MVARLVRLALTLAFVVAGCAVSTPSTPTPGTDRAPGSASAPVTSTAPSAAAPSLPTSGGSWASGVPLPFRRAENAAVAIDGVIYLAGGVDIHGASLDLFEAFDTRTGRWTTLPKLPEPRDHMGLTVADGRIYLSGGGIFAEPDVRSGFWRYDPATGALDGARTDARGPLAARVRHDRRHHLRGRWGGPRSEPARALGVRHPERRVADRPRAAPDRAGAPDGRRGERTADRDRGPARRTRSARSRRTTRRRTPGGRCRICRRHAAAARPA